jgi:ATP-binding cassette subfamily B protein
MDADVSLIKPRLLAPEVVQTSTMDCGPATLKCLLEGFGIPVSYGRLREACQTDVDGTSIDTLEEVAILLGLEAEQTMAPADHLLLPEARLLPAIVVVQLPDGNTHFLLAWRRHGPFLQVMDPATGRRWPTCQRFLDELYIHHHPFPAEAWREWADTESFLGPLRKRLSNLGTTESFDNNIVNAALEDPHWLSLGTLDAAIRTVTAIIHSGGLKRGPQAGKVLTAFFERAREQKDGEEQTIPEAYWSAGPTSPGPEGEEIIQLRGAVLVTVRGRRPASLAAVKKPVPEGTIEEEIVPEDIEEAPELSPELVAALKETPTPPGAELLRLLRADGLLAPLALLAALFLTAGGMVIEALLLRGLLDIGRELGLVGQRLGAMSILLLFAMALLFLELPIAEGLLRLGRRLEIRLRTAFLEKIPRLGDRYFQSRLTSDMAERSHSIHNIRLLPNLGGQLTRAVFELCLTAAGIIWLDPGSAFIALLATVLALCLPFAVQPVLAERDLRVRNHLGALSHFHLDALLGLVTVRTHGAERSVRREYESLLAQWARAGYGLVRAVVAVEGIQFFLGFGLSGWLLLDHLARGGEIGGVLLLIYWALNLPFLGQEIAQLAWQYPSQRSVTLRLLEPLGALEETEEASGSAESSPQRAAGDSTISKTSSVASKTPSSPGIGITLEDVSVRAAGHTILSGINLSIEAGSHIAIVGPSGAGKSSLVGLLLGWHRPADGRILVDDLPLNSQRLKELRRETAWVDPAVQLWNRSFLENLRYGSDSQHAAAMDRVIENAHLRALVEKLPEGLQTPLGEGGALLSGGEGQRVRLGRAMLRPGVRLVILDEPFRGLDREQRRDLLARLRQWWQAATLLCITHDVGDIMNFERVLVVEGGQIVEDGVPSELAKDPESRYRALLEAEETVRKGFWEGDTWQRLRLEGGRMFEEGGKRR